MAQKKKTAGTKLKYRNRQTGYPPVIIIDLLLN